MEFEIFLDAIGKTNGKTKIKVKPNRLVQKLLLPMLPLSF